MSPNEAAFAEVIAEHVRVTTGRRASPSEVRSWQRSLPVLARDLADAGLRRVEMLVEYKLPLTSRRADVVLAGVHPRTGEDSYVVVELKQWSRAEPSELGEHLVIVDGMPGGEQLHPAEQVRRYCEYMCDFLGALNPNAVHGAAYPLVSESVCERSVFPLLDEQRDAYEYVRAAVNASKRGAPKEAVLIVGGPGTGKSVIAVELLGTLNRHGIRAVHATGSRSFTLTLRDNVEKVNRRAARSFSYFNSYTHATPHDIDVLICDEAHRLRETSDRRRHFDGPRRERSQVQELIEAAAVPVFLLDEHQLVRRGEVGSVRLIHDAANDMGVRVQQIDLRHQFRCGGCPEYVAWVEQLLGLGWEHGPQQWQSLETFELYVARTPADMEDFLRARQGEGRTARMAAGFCWPWSDPLADGTLVEDVQIGDWRRPWNSRSEREKNGVPPSSLWATHPAGFGQIGCIYTAQGFEYDYAGVIFGEDLVWRGEGWQANRQANKDSQVNGAPRFGELVRNTYRVLATRGMSGAVLFSKDPETNHMFERLGIPLVSGRGSRGLR
ncbi:DNA/RNA helicase domain-containing protein [Nonomuraea sp. NPDC059023]|uniref:DNA/RNA helicase domain-containing protein n=1 Tax=unclassified Nonomuraea TaxID=2593643 RepID=UPI003692A3FD